MDADLNTSVRSMPKEPRVPVFGGSGFKDKKRSTSFDVDKLHGPPRKRVNKGEEQERVKLEKSGGEPFSPEKIDPETSIFALYPWNDEKESHLMQKLIAEYEASPKNLNYDPKLSDVA
jgi:hypothetical protein